jgi:hypothetical protein
MIGLLFARPTPAEQPTDPRLDKIFADWQKRRERIKTVRYLCSGEFTWPRGSFSDPYTGKAFDPEEPPHDITSPKSIMLLLDFTTNRHRLEVEDQPYSRTQKQFLPKRTTTTVFDDNDLRTFGLQPNGSPTNLKVPNDVVVKGNMRGNPFNSEFWPFFLGHGIVALTAEQHILPGRLSVIPQKDTFHLQGEGNFANRPCLVLRSKTWEYGTVGFDELWVDTSRDSAVLRQVTYVNDKIGMDMQIDYQETKAGWLSQSWTISNAHNGQVFSFERMHVDALDVDPAISDADFRDDVKPGDVVMQRSISGSPDQITAPKPGPSQMYHVSQDGSWNEVVDGVEVAPNRAYYIWAIGLILPLALAGVGYFLWRWRPKRNRG